MTTPASQTQSKAPLTTLIPVRRVGPGYLQLRDPEQFVIVFKLQGGICPWGDSSDSIQRKMQAFDHALQQLRSDEQVQFFTRRVKLDGVKVAEDYAKLSKPEAPAAYRNGYSPYYQVWLQAQVDGAGISDYETYALFTVQPPEINNANGFLSGIFGMRSKTGAELSFEDVSRRAHSWADNLGAAGLKTTDVPEGDIYKLLYEEVVLGAVDVDPASFAKGSGFSGGEDGHKTIREMLAATPWDFSDGNSYRIGDQYGHVLPVTEFPEADKYFLFLQELYRERINFRVSLFVSGVNQEQSKEIIEGQMRKDQATQFKGSLVNEDSAASFQERAQVMGLLARRETSLAKFALYINVLHTDFDELQSTVEKVSKLFPGYHQQEGYYEQKELLRSSLPFGRNYCRHHMHLTSTNILQNAIAFFEDPMTQGDGVPMGTSLGGQLVKLDLWGSNLNNWNVGVFGIAGTGKSFGINHLAIRCLPMDPSVMIVDASGSYEYLCKTAGGNYLKVSLNNPDACINPFHYDVEELKKNSGEVRPDHVGNVLGFLEVLCSEVGSAGLPNLAISILEEAIKLTYKATYTRKGEEAIPLLRDFHDALKEMGEDKSRTADIKNLCKNYAMMLQPYIREGSFANLTDRRTSVDESSKFIVFDVKDLPDNEKLKALSVYIITQYCLVRSEQNKKKLRKSLLILDEAWTLVQFPAGCEFLLKVAKTSRHLMLASIFATQQVSDILNHPQAKPLFDNASLKLLLGLADTDLPLVEKLMELTDNEIGKLRNLRMVRGQYSQVLVVSAVQRGVLNLTPDELSLVVATTYPPERLERDHYQRKYAPDNDPVKLFQALVRWADDRRAGKVEKVIPQGKDLALLNLPLTETELLKKLSEKYSPTKDPYELLRTVSIWAADKGNQPKEGA